MIRLPRAVALAALLVGVATGCGKKGPPLAPLRPPPGRVADLQARRRGDRVELRFTIPALNADATKPPVIERVEFYAVASAAGVPAPPLAQMLASKNLRGHIDVRPRADAETARPDNPPDSRPAPGDPATYVGHIATDVGPAPPSQAAVLRYVAVGVAGGRKTPSAIVAVSLGQPPAPPQEPHLGYDEHTLTLEWQAGAAHDVFRVYDTDEAGAETTGRPLSATPITVPKFSTSVEFGKERCLVVRAVEVAGTAAVESDPAGPKCVTPVDTFPPPAPTISTPVVSEGAVSLIWDAVEAPDLAGYLVLRADGASDKLQQLTPAPIVETQYRDTTTKAGVQYTYVVAAVDKSTPPNRSESKPVVVIGRF